MWFFAVIDLSDTIWKFYLNQLTSRDLFNTIYQYQNWQIVKKYFINNNQKFALIARSNQTGIYRYVQSKQP